MEELTEEKVLQRLRDRKKETNPCAWMVLFICRIVC